MPQTNAEKDTKQLLGELSQSLAGNQSLLDKITELQYREIKSGDVDDLVQGGLAVTRGGIRPKHAPIVP